MRQTWVGLLGLLLFAAAAAAQSTDATVTGAVTDPSGANVPNAVVTAENLATGVVSRTTANAAGVYSFAALIPGKYNFAAELSGFRRSVAANVELEVGARLTLNIALEIGGATEVVQVEGANAQLNYASSSVGNVVSGRQVLELPLAGRNSYDLVSTQAGVVGESFSGNRRGSLNFTLDGINAQDNLLNGTFNAVVSNRVNVDRAEEFRIVTSPADAELGRGSGQIQVITRGGTNSFRGSVYEEHRNTALTANTWFNNQRGRDPRTGQEISPRNVLIRNQFGGRLGGPIKKNRTFFHGLYDGERQRQRNAATATVFTDTARRGLFRFFPGAQNANANSRTPVVDAGGNPIRPAAATGDLQTVSVFGRDPNRPGADPTGAIGRILSAMPLPNNYFAGDGLNTAGFVWSRPVNVEFELYEVRVDHMFSTNHRMSASFSHQAYDSLNVVGPQPYPDSPGGRGPTETTQYIASLTSVFRPNLVNEFRAGVFRPRVGIIAPYAKDNGGTKLMPVANGIPYILDMASVTEPLLPTNYASDPSGRLSPVYQFGNTISWLKGRHSFRGGVEARLVSSAGFDEFAVQPRATIGAGAVPVQGVLNIPGIGQNTAGGQNLLLDLSGSLGNAFQVYNADSAKNPLYIAGLSRYRNWSQHEYSFFFKDDFKVNQNLTLNLGLRYEWYASPHERQQRGLGLVGGGGGIFGITGTSFGDLFQPNVQRGSLTRTQAVGPGTDNPNTRLYGQDWNNFSPNVGLAWSLPWWGKNKTVLRAGYGIAYERNPIYLTHDVSGLNPGLSETTIFLSGSLINMSNLRLPLTPITQPLQTIPLTQRTQTIRSYTDELRTPYIQNFSATLTRQVAKNSFLEARYVGSKGTRLIRNASINEANIFENGILDAYLITQAGGNAPLFDRIFAGLSGVGTTISGSDLMRTNPNTQGFFANNNPGGLANFISNTNQFTGVNGGLLRRAGLPENFVNPNPQFATAILSGNFANSTYHSLQVEFTRRFSDGMFLQGNYTWSRAIGEDEGEDAALFSQYRTLRNRRADKRLLDFHRTHVWKFNGIYELPFGKDKWIGGGAPRWLNHIIGGWQTGGIFQYYTGNPLTLSSLNAFNGFTTASTSPNQATDIPRSLGSVTVTPNGPVYFAGLQQVVDPWVQRITTAQQIQSRSVMRAITDASGKLLLVNPQPGQLGNVALNFISGPANFRFDLNLIKRIAITERWNLQLRADAINLTNSPQWGNPNMNINSPDFGRISSAGGTRIVVLQVRLSF